MGNNSDHLATNATDNTINRNQRNLPKSPLKLPKIDTDAYGNHQNHRRGEGEGEK